MAAYQLLDNGGSEPSLIVNSVINVDPSAIQHGGINVPTNSLQGFPMNYNSGNQKQQQMCNISNTNTLQFNTFYQGQDYYSGMIPNACVPAAKTGSSQAIYFVTHSTEQNMNDSVRPNENVPPMGSNEVTGSRSCGVIDSRVELEVDGMPQFPPQEDELIKIIYDGGLLESQFTSGTVVDTQAIADQSGETDILKTAVAVIDPEFLGAGDLPLQGYTNDTDNNDLEDILSSLFNDTANTGEIGCEGNTEEEEQMPPAIATQQGFHDAQPAPLVTIDDSSLLPTDPEPESVKKSKRSKRKPAKQTTEPPPTSKKRRMYEIDEPFDDKELEKKRLNAIRARKNRERNKKGKLTVEEELQAVAKERDNLKNEVSELYAKMKELEAIANQRCPSCRQ